MDKFVIGNSKGLHATITNYGAAIMSLLVPDKEGALRNVVLGYDAIEKYVEDQFYRGSIVGRVANRIANGRFIIDDQAYQISKNAGHHHLHGGYIGWSKVIWALDHHTENSLRLTYESRDREEGYPGNAKAIVSYAIENGNTISITIEVTVDRPTIVNPTSHCYFNISGDPATSIQDHELMIHADHYLPVLSDLIPTGEIASVENTPMDFRKSIRIGENIHRPDEQLRFGKGFDHNYVLKDYNGKMRECATLFSPASGIKMTLCTNQPGVQFFSGKFLEVKTIPPSQEAQEGLCLETQGFPNAVNYENFPPIILRPGEEYINKTSYTFS